MLHNLRRLARTLLATTALTCAAGQADAQLYTMSGNYKIGYGLTLTNVPTAWSRGWTGKGVTVSVFDTGLNTTLNGITGNVAGPGWDATTNKAGVTTDGQYHGTFVSSIIAANANMRGVAYDAKLLPIRVLDSTGTMVTTDANMATAIDYARSNGSRVQNNSWNSSLQLSDLGSNAATTALNINKYWYPLELAAWNRAVAAGSVIVFAAGNYGTSSPGYYAAMPLVNPTLMGGWIAVVGTDTSGTIASWSNRCGVTAAFCMAAPGTSILGLYGTGVSTNSGTSFSAPIVSGAVAVLMQQWPYLTNQQVTTILFATANKSGIYANSAVYGQGMLDMARATQPLGTTSVPLSNTVQGSQVSITATGIAASPLLVKSLSQGLAGVNVMVLDSMGRAYSVPGQALVSNIRGNRSETTDVVSQFGAVAPAQHNGVTTMGWSGTMGGQTASFSQTQNPTGMNTALSSGAGLGWAFGPTSTGAVRVGELPFSQDIGNPYLNLQPRTDGMAVGFGGSTWATRVGAFQSAQPGPNSTMFQTASISGMVGEVSYLPREGTRVGVNLGMTNERGTFLGSASSGATNLGAATQTTYMGLTAQESLGANTTLMAGVYAGTRTSSSARGIVHLGSVQTASAYLGLVQGNLMTAGDRLGFVVGVPNHVVGGRANWSVPVSRDMAGNIDNLNFSTSLASGSTPASVQLYYNRPVGETTVLNVGAAVRTSDAGTGGRSSGIGMVKLTTTF